MGAALDLAGWPAESRDVALAVARAEGGEKLPDGSEVIFVDAVGDTTLISAKWGPSISPFQIRSLREPMAFGPADRWRYAFALRFSLPFAIAAALAISEGGTDWTKWSTFRDGAYQKFLGHDYPLVTGHARAGLWNL